MLAFLYIYFRFMTAILDFSTTAYTAQCLHREAELQYIDIAVEITLLSCIQAEISCYSISTSS